MQVLLLEPLRKPLLGRRFEAERAEARGRQLNIFRVSSLESARLEGARIPDTEVNGPNVDNIEVRLASSITLSFNFHPRPSGNND
jgi:hypothetical protein